MVELPGAPHLERFGNHYGPRDDGEDDEAADDDLGFRSRLPPNVEQLEFAGFRPGSRKK